MKPTINTTDCEKNKDVVVVSPSVERSSNSKPRRKGCIVVTVVGILLFAATIVGVFVGIVNHNRMHTYCATYHLNDGVTVSETIELTDTEESISVPESVSVVFDFENEWFFVKPSGMDECYVSKFNTSALMTPIQAQKRYHDENIEETINGNATIIKIRFTDVEANIQILSSLASQMCSDADLFWMEILKEDYAVGKDREKRSYHELPGQSYGPMCVNGPRWITCFIWRSK